MVGLGCATVPHRTTRIQGNEEKIKISAGSAARLTFLPSLVRKWHETVADPQKFARLVERLGRNDDRGKDDLRTRLLEDAAAFIIIGTQTVNTDSCRPRPYGCGRTNPRSGAIESE